MSTLSGWPERRIIGLVLGPMLFMMLLVLPTPQNMQAAALSVGAVAFLMAIWWITEAIPLAATALLPIVLFPALGVISTANTTTAYANHLVYLFMGGFLIAMAGALLLFVIPSDFSKREFLLDWPTAVKLPWDILILFGGGFALAKGFSDSGLTEWIVTQLSILQGVHLVVLVLAVTLVVIFLTEVTSNTATATLVLPVMGALAGAVEVLPLYLMVPTAVAASYAFMLPVATPPNAIIFSSRYVTIPQMARTGLWMNLLASLVITVFVMLLLPVIQ